MGRTANARVALRDPVSMRDAVSAAIDQHPYADALKLLDRSTAQRVLADDPIRKPESDAFARAVKRIGGIKKGAERANLAEHHLIEIIFGGLAPDALDCTQVERACARAVSCEEMRRDLLWFRDPAGEIVGYAERLEGTQVDLDAAIAASVAAKASDTPADNVIDSLFGTRNEKALNWWQNVALTSWSEDSLTASKTETLEHIANSAENLLYGFERGITAANKLLWAAIDSEWAEMRDVADLTWFLASVGAYAIELRQLKGDMDFQIQKRRA